MGQEFVPGDIAKHKLGFDILVLEVNPKDDGWSFDGILGEYMEEKSISEGYFRWCEIE